jgi:hypothetical protein
LREGAVFFLPLLEVAAGIDGEVAHQPRDVGEIAALPEDVIVPEHDLDGQVVRQQRRPQRVGAQCARG